MPIENPGVQARLHMLDANRDAISVMMGKAVERGMDVSDVVVVVVDQRDPIGAELAEGAAKKAGLDAVAEGTRAVTRGEIPTAIMVLNLNIARSLFAETHPEVAHALARPPHQECVRTVVIAAGSAMLVHAQVRAVRATA